MPDRHDDQQTRYAPLVGFQSRKAAQVCAYFAGRSSFQGRDGTIEKLKLIKLVYWSEREALAQRHAPMLYDELFSAPHGPICSSTLNGIDGKIHCDVWDEFIARNGNVVLPIKRFQRAEFDEISDAEIEFLDKVWQKFEHKSASQMRNLSHRECAEYTETEGRIPIAYSQVLEALGETDVDHVDREIAEFRRAENAFGG